MQDRITSSYLHNLQAIYHRIDNRGIRASRSRMREAKIFIDQQIKKNLTIASSQWGCYVFVGKENELTDPDDPNHKDQVNINATQGPKMLLTKLQNLGYKVPKIPKKQDDGSYEAKYSTAELALQKMLVNNDFNWPGGDPAIRAILEVRELGKIKSSYLGCRYYEDGEGDLFYLTNYNVAGTLTGRRSSRKHSFGYGNNAQNFPKHGKLAEIFRKCLIARSGNIFLMVDQKSAEDWPVSALAQNYNALDQLKKGINRHCIRGSRVFGIPLLEPILDNQDKWKKDHFHEYYLGKKIGHANNYGMRGNRMSDSLAQEGHSISAAICQQLLDKANALEPEIKNVFHKYIQERINSTRILKTPFGRDRQFLGLRPNDSNWKILNEAYSYIPQSVVGDNTGFAVSYLESSGTSTKFDSKIVQEGHDSIVQDIPDDIETIWHYLKSAEKAFDRTIRFHNGIEVKIPIEAELGYDFNTTVSLHDLSRESLERAYNKIKEIHQAEIEAEEKQKDHEKMSSLIGAI